MVALKCFRVANTKGRFLNWLWKASIPAHKYGHAVNHGDISDALKCTTLLELGQGLMCRHVRTHFSCPGERIQN